MFVFIQSIATVQLHVMDKVPYQLVLYGLRRGGVIGILCLAKWFVAFPFATQTGICKTYSSSNPTAPRNEAPIA